MRRPNPWIAIPSLILGVLAGGLGWIVTDVSCQQAADASPCLGWSVFFALVGFLVVAVSVAIVLVLVYRSLAEWRERTE